MQYVLFRFENVLISSSVTKGLIREIHVEIVLSLKLTITDFQFGPVDNQVIVNVLSFVVSLTSCPVTYLSTSFSKAFVIADEKL